MNPTVVLKSCGIIEVESRPYTKKDGTAAQYRSVMFKYQGKIFKLGVTQGVDFSRIQQSDGLVVDLSVELSTFGDSLTPDMRIASVLD